MTTLPLILSSYPFKTKLTNSLSYTFSERLNSCDNHKYIGTRFYSSNVPNKEDTIKSLVDTFDWDSVSPKKRIESSSLKPLHKDFVVNISHLSRANLVTSWTIFMDQCKDLYNPSLFSKLVVRICYVKTLPTSHSIKLSTINFNNLISFTNKLEELLSISKDNTSFICVQHPDLARRLDHLHSYVKEYTKNIENTNNADSEVSSAEASNYILKNSTVEGTLNIEIKERVFSNKLSISKNAFYCNITLEDLEKFKKTKIDKKVKETIE